MMGHREYRAIKADHYSNTRSKLSHAKDRLKNDQIRKYCIEKLRIGWSPEQTSGKISEDLPGQYTNYESIYQYIYNDAKYLIQYLARGRQKRQKRGKSRGNRACKIPNRTSIDARPEEINTRSRTGDWEADTMVSKQSKETLVVLRERKIHLTFIVKVRNKSAKELKRAIIKRLKHLPPHLRKSITFDNGTENALHEEIAFELNLKTFFCHAYHSWEKGSVENTNGLIRRFLPKKTDFSLITEDQIMIIEERLNNRPRKTLNYSTPYELLKNCA
jgi:IS30 family transposase